MKVKYLYDSEDDMYLSWTKIKGKKIKDIKGYISNDFGDPVFKIDSIVYEDGSYNFCEGDCDFPYIHEEEDKVQELIEKIHNEEEDK